MVQSEFVNERSTLKELYLGSDKATSAYSEWNSVVSINSVASLLKFAIGVSSLRKIEIQGITQSAYKAVPLITRTSRKTIQEIHIPNLAVSSDNLHKILSECSVLSELTFQLTAKSEVSIKQHFYHIKMLITP